MQEARLANGANSNYWRRFAEVRPRVYQDGNRVSLQFQIGEIQSEMLASDPNFLLLSYTRTMVAFTLFHHEPKRIAMIGLGGGSMPKWCYHQLPSTHITVIEISQMVISLREQFSIPADGDRFRVICGDGADYVAGTEDSPEVLLVDGFDIHGQPPQLCSQEFYEDCYRALAPDGVLVVNLCSTGFQPSVDRIRKTFDDRVLVVIPEDGENKVVFAVKGKRLRMEDEPADELAKKFRADYVLIPSLVQSDLVHRSPVTDERCRYGESTECPGADTAEGARVSEECKALDNRFTGLLSKVTVDVKPGKTAAMIKEETRGQLEAERIIE